MEPTNQDITTTTKRPQVLSSLRLAPEIHERARNYAFHNKTSLRQLIEDGLRLRLDQLEDKAKN